jgi:comEA protein
MITFTPSERKALIFVIIILAAASLTHIFYPYIYQPLSRDYVKQDSIFSRYSKLHSNICSPKEEIYLKRNGLLKNDTSSNDRDVRINFIVNINTASSKELQKLPGIGPVLARRIMEYRTQHGEFKSIEELKKVKGIGHRTMVRLKSLIKI